MGVLLVSICRGKKIIYMTSLTLIPGQFFGISQVTWSQEGLTVHSVARNARDWAQNNFFQSQSREKNPAF